MDQPEPKRISDTVFAVVDLETTGFNPQKDRIVQMAAVLVNGRGEVVDTFDTVVKPESPEQYEHGAEHVHGISREMVENGMPLRSALSRIWSLTDGRVFTAHNARFDISFLEAESERVGMRRQVDNYLDTLALARQADSDRQRKHSLQALCEHYGVTVERAHEAMSDAKATATILMKLIDELGVESTDQLPGFSPE
jgi:DNA polymerase III epsilon subunit family exonuclease